MDSNFIQKLIDDSARQLINDIIIFITPYIQDIITGAIAIGIVVMIGNWTITNFGELLDYSKSEIEKAKKLFRSFIDLISAIFDAKRNM